MKVPCEATASKGGPFEAPLFLGALDVVPFPDLPCPVPSNKPMEMKCQQPGSPRPSVEEERTISSSAKRKSAPISLPKSHIRHTPSELHMEALTIMAQQNDVRMYSRLLCGMQNQARRRYFATDNDGEVEATKSAQGIVKTKQGSSDQGPKLQDEEMKKEDADDVGWNWAYVSIDDEDSGPCARPVARASTSSQGSKGSSTSLIPDANEDGPEDDCIFSMEL